jgi:hypothetical protein
MSNHDRPVIKRLSLSRETIRIHVRTAIRTGPSSSNALDVESVRQGTLSATGAGLGDHSAKSAACSQ